MTTIDYEEMKKKNLFLGLQATNKITWHNYKKDILEFWEYDTNYVDTVYVLKFEMHVEDMKKVIEYIELCEYLMEKDLPANCDLHYTMVPKVYLGQYYYLKTFTSYVTIRSKEKPDSRFGGEDNLWIPINSDLLKGCIKRQPCYDFKITVNGKPIEGPLSIESAKMLGIIE